MIEAILIWTVILGLLNYFAQQRLHKAVSRTAETSGKVFSDSDVQNLKLILYPLAGCLLVYSMLIWHIYGYGRDWGTFIPIIAAIVELILAFWFIKLCIKAGQDFSYYGKRLYNVVCVYAIVPVILGGLVLLITLFVCHYENLTILSIIMAVTSIPTFKHFPALRNEFKKALYPAEETPTVSVDAGKVSTPTSSTQIKSKSKLTKRCPCCGEEILTVAKKCKHCGEWLVQQ